MESLILGNTTFSLQIIRKRISSIRLRIIDKHSLSISASPFIPLFAIKKFVKDNELWILQHSNKLVSPKKLLEIKSIPIIGQEFKLVITKSSRDSLIVLEDQKTLHLHLSILTESHLKKTLDSRIRPFALKIIKQELRSMQLVHHFLIKNVTVRNQTSRFGSCSSRGNLNFNWQIILFPPDKFRHVLFHEIAHLTQHNHSPNFWKLLATYDPEWRMNRLWLKQQGTKHFLIQ